MPLRAVADQLRYKLRRRPSTFLHGKHQGIAPPSPPITEELPSPRYVPFSSKRASSHRHSEDTPASPPEVDTTATPTAPTPPIKSPSRRHHGNKQPKKEYPPSSDTLVHGIGDYHFVEQIGHGKFSKVWLARHFKSGHQVAIKIIDKRAHEYRVMSRLVREVALMEILDHKNIIHLYETYETADSLYIVMEYVPGVNLDEHLKQSNGHLSEEEARHVFRQLVAAVDYCHRHWVVHRDIKTPNVLLMPGGEIRLADFGLGNRYGPHQRLKTLCGSMLYYSPEIFTGQRYTGPEVDCWCLGVSLFRMTAGFEPFGHARDQDQLKKYVVSGNYPMPENLSSGLQATIRKCLTVDRRKRMGVRQALKDDAWLNDYGRLEDLFEHEDHMSSHDKEATAKLERERIRQRYLRDLEEEKSRGRHVRKTILYHPISPSIYFTSRSVQYTPYSKRDHIVQSQEMLQKQLIKQVRAELQQAQLHPLSAGHDMQSPIHRLLRKLKVSTTNGTSGTEPTKRLKKTASTLSLSQLYQRVAKDQITYYTLQPDIYKEQQPHDHAGVVGTSREETLVQLVRSACGLLGIVYRHDTPLRLVCVMNMQRITTPQSASNAFYADQQQQPQRHHIKASNSTPMLNQQHDTQRSGSFATMDGTTGGKSSLLSNASTRTSSRWSKALKRLSSPFTHNPDETVMMPWSQSFHFQSSMANSTQFRYPQHTMPPSSSNTPPPPPPLQHSSFPESDQDKEQHTTAIFTIEAFASSDDGTVVGLRFSKMDGSSKVFKYAKGWVTGVLAYHVQVPL
ncbi:kinase-like protein [Lichtheimia hyalospora FSU 10163]|nr:kinase-like protein [Lichtheimia hyalospora FSU 10163]